jgi:hypothetical protein
LEERESERIDLIALAMLLKADIRDLARYAACYVPPASPVWEPLNFAASTIYSICINTGPSSDIVLAVNCGSGQ